MRNRPSQTLKIDIDPKAIAQNYQTFVQSSGAAKCGAAIKADAYGCGVQTIAPILLANGCQDFFVADAQEGAILRKLVSNANIYVLTGVFEETVPTIVANNLIPIINSNHQFNVWQNAGCLQSEGQTPTHPYALHVDSGMNRLGVSTQEAAQILDQVPVKPCYILSHFACADDVNNPKNAAQLSAFQALVTKYPEIKASMANSAATLSNPNSRFDLTRPGIGIYGGNPFSTQENPMAVAVTAMTKIIDIRQITKGETVSYGGTFTAQKPMKIATCGVGYADGYPRSASGHGIALRSAEAQGAQVYFKGMKFDCVGRSTMDLTMFDVSDIKDTALKIGDWLELFGHNILIDELADRTGTISYEILSSIGRRNT